MSSRPVYAAETDPRERQLRIRPQRLVERPRRLDPDVRVQMREALFVNACASADLVLVGCEIFPMPFLSCTGRSTTSFGTKLPTSAAPVWDSCWARAGMQKGG